MNGREGWYVASFDPARDDYVAEIAPARTFSLKEEAEMSLEKKLGVAFVGMLFVALLGSISLYFFPSNSQID